MNYSSLPYLPSLSNLLAAAGSQAQARGLVGAWCRDKGGAYEINI